MSVLCCFCESNETFLQHPQPHKMLVYFWMFIHFHLFQPC